jgi:hypothetical protein
MAQTPQIKIEQWSETFIDTPVFFQVYHLNASLFIWMGDKQGKLKNLNIGLNTPYVSIRIATVTPSEHITDYNHYIGFWE